MVIRVPPKYSDFYPRPPRGGRLPVFPQDSVGCEISIHALREEGDRRPKQQRKRRKQFLSTPSARRATSRFLRIRQRTGISIHALREEGDLNPM